MTTENSIFGGCASSKRAGSCAKLDVHNWLKDIQNTQNKDEIIEIRFKNTRKDYYRNVNKLPLEVGDLVAVEGNPGHDIGMVSVTGDLVLRQMKRHKVTMVNGELRKVYRKAKSVDIEKWEFAMSREHETMIKSRQLASDLHLNMKIGDVEYQGDGTKAIFYYIADVRVDFRQLIKVLAESFHIRVEMKQIGARQEAGRIGGIGPCGRELCCSSWMSNFSSVNTIAARHQEISMNPQKLAGQCSKLKCCINYEVDSYIDEQRDFPPKEKLETEEGAYIYLKSDIFKRIYYYTFDSKAPTGQIAVPVARVKKIMRMNQKGEKPERLIEIDNIDISTEKIIPNYENVVGQDSLTRFDKPKEENRRKKRRVKRRPKPDDNKPISKDDKKADNSNKRKIFKKKSSKKRRPGNNNNNNKTKES